VNPAGGNSGYAIVPVTAGTGTTNGGNSSAALSYSATMTAPAAAGTYIYNVFTNQGITDPDGQASSTSYTITVAPVVTVPPTTVPPTTVPPTTVPPVAGANISSLSPTHGLVGSKVTIKGAGFGTRGSVKFGTADATETTSTAHEMVVTVPAMDSNFLPMTTVVEREVWNRHARTVLVTVTPQDGAASIGVTFTLDSAKGGHEAGHKAGHKGDHKGDHRVRR
ncbi:MAG TPA: IPT/TIG domain-containing protein, partial [Dermatophilaceae bacterium]